MTDQISRPTQRGCPKPVLVLILLALIAGPLLGLFPAYAAPGYTAPSAGFTVNNIGDGSDANPGDSVCETAAGNGVCTLRAAIEETNALSGADTINFDGSIAVVMPDDPLPALNDPTGGTTIKGNPTWILGSFAGTDTDGFVLGSDNNKLQGLHITNFGGTGVRVYGDNNVIGTDGDGVDDAAEGNVISSNGESGVRIAGGTENRVAGNYIGLTPDGQSADGNGLYGVLLSFGAHANWIGTNGDGTSDELERNVISGNQDGGVHLYTNCTDNVIAGNYIGTNAAGDAAVRNYGHGINISVGGTNNLVGTNGDGSADELERNVISGNRDSGILLDNSSTNNVIAGNYIGTNAAGDAAIANFNEGVSIESDSTSNLIGTDGDGTADELERNVISGNNQHGIEIYTDGNIVAGNYIGTNAAGDTAIPNGNDGVILRQCANNRIGGTLAVERNVISGNGWEGVVIMENATANLVQGNYIGTDASGNNDLGNALLGVGMADGVSDNIVGGTASGEGNRIAFNGQAGIWLNENDPGDHSDNNRFRGNAIFANGDLGIDLLPEEGVTPNDPGDGDEGANHLQNFPVLSSATSDGSQVIVTGALNSSSNSTFELDFYANSSCDASGYGEGETYLGTDSVTTDINGDVTFTTTLPGSVPVGDFVTATATDQADNTSEFSACSLVTIYCEPVHGADFSWAPPTPIVDQGVTLTGTAAGTAPIAFTWDLGDGNTASGVVVQHSYSAANDYTIIMTATNCVGTAIATQTHTVTVQEPPCEPVQDADFSWAPLTPLVDQVVTLTGTASGTAPIAFTWDLGDGSTGSGAVVQHSYSAASDYTIIMTATNCTGTAIATQTHTVTVQEPPCEPVQDAAFGWMPTTPAIDEIVTLTGSANGSSPITFTWAFGDSATGSGATITHTYAATGTYIVLMTATNACGHEGISHTLTVVTEPVCTPVQITAVITDISDCTVSFAAELYGDAPFTYLWDLDDGVTSTLEAPTHAYTASGTYTVTIDVWNCADQGHDTYTLPVTLACPLPDYKVFLPLVCKNHGG